MYSPDHVEGCFLPLAKLATSRHHCAVDGHLVLTPARRAAYAVAVRVKDGEDIVPMDQLLTRALVRLRVQDDIALVIGHLPRGVLGVLVWHNGDGHLGSGRARARNDTPGPLEEKYVLLHLAKGPDHCHGELISNVELELAIGGDETVAIRVSERELVLTRGQTHVVRGVPAIAVKVGAQHLVEVMPALKLDDGETVVVRVTVGPDMNTNIHTAIGRRGGRCGRRRRGRGHKERLAHVGEKVGLIISRDGWRNAAGEGKILNVAPHVRRREVGML
mmetsp:Transcript_12073/g.35931  ORF Transcript_12073/g.35931 Transcript_12073/m.35931 type:complete len:275 (-) Transcript_12073:1245-2069(-)